MLCKHIPWGPSMSFLSQFKNNVVTAHQICMPMTWPTRWLSPLRAAIIWRKRKLAAPNSTHDSSNLANRHSDQKNGGPTSKSGGSKGTRMRCYISYIFNGWTLTLTLTNRTFNCACAHTQTNSQTDTRCRHHAISPLLNPPLIISILTLLQASTNSAYVTYPSLLSSSLSKTALACSTDDKLGFTPFFGGPNIE